MNGYRARLIFASFWIGSLWTVAIVVMPTIFATVADKAVAGSIAREIFRSEALVSLICGGFVLLNLFASRDFAERPKDRKVLAILAVSILALTMAIRFGIQPMMTELQQQAGSAGLSAEQLKSKFGLLHTISTGLYLLQCVLGVGLLAKLR